MAAEVRPIDRVGRLGRVAGRVVGLVALGRLAGSLAGELALEAVPGHGVHAEGGEQLAEDVVRRQVAVLQLTVVRHDLLGDEVAHGRLHHALLVRPLDHR
jgi:predicted RNA-binding protein